MLLTLQINNFALIDRLELNFGPGLNILTGETGAGKSILIDAVGVVLGERAAAEYIRTGSDIALVEAVFDATGNQALADCLGNLGWEDDGEGLLLLSREINRSGRNICRINGRIATTAMLKEVSQHLVDIHGQHEHQSLLRTEKHLALLDSFGGTDLEASRTDYAALYQRAGTIKARLRKLGGGGAERGRRIDLLQFQLDEIDGARLSPGEEETLLAERNLAANAGKLFAFAARGHALLYEGSDRQRSVTDQLGSFAAELTEVTRIDPKLESLREAVSGINAVLDDVVREIRQYQDAVEFSPERLEEIELRLDVINQLKRKYGSSIPAILNYRQQIESEMEVLLGSETSLCSLQQELTEVSASLARAGDKLSRLRREAADRLEREITGELADLMMKQTRFAVAFGRESDPNGLLIDGIPVVYTASGVDRVEFLISPNPGEPLKPLVRIASGGEISRVMLAIKTVLVTADRIPTLIFDEIDAGVGGRAAQAVARKLSGIAAQYQVVCITHLPPIASMADTHFAISKEITANRTRTAVNLLDRKARVMELARMLGGDGLTAITLEHAREMLDQAADQKAARPRGLRPTNN